MSLQSQSMTYEVMGPRPKERIYCTEISLDRLASEHSHSSTNLILHISPSIRHSRIFQVNIMQNITNRLYLRTIHAFTIVVDDRGN